MGKHVDDGWSRLGGAIRERRLRRSLSLVGLAALAELSQPFLSQIENGRARPSLLSLRRIAEALDTTPQALFEGPLHAPHEPTIVRARDVQAIDIAGSDGGGSCRLLLAGDAPVHLIEFDGLPSRFLDLFEHDGYEVLHVVAGVAEVEVDGVVTALAAGDSMAYASRSPHRFRSVGIGVARVLLVETARDDRRDRGRNDGRDAECTDHAARRAGAHVVTRTARGRRTVQPAGRPGRSGGDDTMS